MTKINNSEKIKVTADCVIFSKGKVLMMKRQIEPYKGSWVLPGGHMEINETVQEALKREIKEETGLDIGNNITLIDVYSDTKRDPRERTISCAYYTEKDNIKDIKLNKEADDFGFFSFDNLPKNIGFDHRDIINDAITKTKK